MKMYLATILGSIGVLNLVVSYLFGVAGLTYGLVDQGVLMLGAYLGWEIDPWIAKHFKGARSGMGVLVGALVGNTISDCLGAVTDPDMRSMVLGITNGCLIPLFLLPLIEKWKAWKEKQSDEEVNYDGFIVMTPEAATKRSRDAILEAKDDCSCGNGLVYDTKVERGVRVPLWTEKTLRFFADAVREAREKGYAIATVVRRSEVPGWNFTPARRAYDHQEQLMVSEPINQREDF